MTLLIHELKRNLKTLLIWAFSVGILCGGCLLLFGGLEESMQEMAGAFSDMGAFSAALGMDKISISTMKGYYATEIALVFSLGGAMFAAMTGAALISKEEEGHTSEFLNTLPFGRYYISGWKYAALGVLILMFNIICLIWICLGFAGAGEWPPAREFIMFHGAQLLMQMETGSVCFLISALSRQRQIGGSLGLAIGLYLVDIICRVIPDMEKLKYVTPYYFSNGADIFADGRLQTGMIVTAFTVTAICAAAAVMIYSRRDLAA